MKYVFDFGAVVFQWKPAQLLRRAPEFTLHFVPLSGVAVRHRRARIPEGWLAWGGTTVLVAALTGAGVMLSAGDPASGEAGYVVLEVAELTIGERSGTFAMQQLGTMSGGQQSITYLVTPGSGTGGFAGISGRLELEIRDGEHRYDLVHDLPDA